MRCRIGSSSGPLDAAIMIYLTTGIQSGSFRLAAVTIGVNVYPAPKSPLSVRGQRDRRANQARRSAAWSSPGQTSFDSQGCVLSTVIIVVSPSIITEYDWTRSLRFEPCVAPPAASIAVPRHAHYLHLRVPRSPLETGDRSRPDPSPWASVCIAKGAGVVGIEKGLPW